MNWIIYIAVIYFLIGGALFQTAFQEGRLAGKPYPRYFWLKLPFWILIYIKGMRIMRKKRKSP